MKQKMIKLFMLIITVGVFSSSKSTNKCAGKCIDVNKSTELNNESITGGSLIERPMTPGNFLFFY